jgi:hypothetical protein
MESKMFKTTTVTVAQNQFADVVRGKSIRIYGRFAGSDFDKTFQIGDTVEVDSYNLTYFGEIVQITDKTVTIEPRHGQKNKRLSLSHFTWRNYDFDYQKRLAANAGRMD